MKQYKVFICGGDSTPGQRDACPNAVHDWPLPSGFGDAADEAARRLARGWGNRRCPECGLYGWTLGRVKGTTAELWERQTAEQPERRQEGE